MTKVRDQQIYMLVALWIEDNPDPEISDRLMREYTTDFSSSGFLVEEVQEAVRQYRRDYQYPKRNFGFLWDLCKQIRANRLDILDPGAAFEIVKRFKNDNAFLASRNVTPDNFSEYVSPETAMRLATIVNQLGWRGIFTDHEPSDRARFIQAYKTVDNRMTNLETWKMPHQLLPEGVRSVAQLIEKFGANKE